MARSSTLKASGDGLKRLAELGKQLGRRPSVKVGVFAGNTSVREATKKTGASASTAGLSTVQVAIINEFREDVGPGGTGPARAPLRGTADAKREDWFKLLENALAKVIRGKTTLRIALELVGLRASADVRNRILSGKIRPPNAPSTIARKGSSLPLVDTAQMVNSYSYQVDEG